MTAHSEIMKGYIVQFEAEREHDYMSATDYLIAECGWTENEAIDCIKFAFFVAKVSLLDHSGEELATDYLGACIYETVGEFYTKYRTDYYADMVRSVFDEAGIGLTDDAMKQYKLARNS